MSASAQKPNLVENDEVKGEVNRIYPNSNLRENYLKAKSEIEQEFGSLESMRLRLGLSRRKICQLLLVDPSAWTRWTKSSEGAPPHVYQSLRWYIQLHEKGQTPEVEIVDEEIDFNREFSRGSTRDTTRETSRDSEEQSHMPMVLEAKMLQISTVYEKQLSKISQEIENLKSVLVVKDDISKTVRDTVKETVSDAIALQMAQHMAKLQPQGAPQQPQVVVQHQPDPRAEQLRYDNLKYQAQVEALESSLRTLRNELERTFSSKKKVKAESVYEDDVETSPAQVANRFMAGTLIVILLAALVYAFIEYA